MKRRSIVLFALVAGGLAAAPGHAQDTRIGSRLAKPDYIRSEHDPKSAVRSAHQMVACLYLKSSSRVRTALGVTEREDALAKLAALQPRGTCHTLRVRDDNAQAQQVRYPPDIYRGMLAEAAIRQDFKGRTLPAVAREQVYTRPWFAATTRPAVVDEMAACVADTDPSGIQSLLATMPETPDEAAATAKLMPSLGPCLTAGATLNANQQSLRAALAEALYHRFTAPAPASVAAK